MSNSNSALQAHHVLCSENTLDQPESLLHLEIFPVKSNHPGGILPPMLQSNQSVIDILSHIFITEDPKYAEVKKRLKTELERWMKTQNDPGAAMDVPLPPKPKRKRSAKKPKQ